MKAAVLEEAADRLQLREIEDPVPDEGQVVIDLEASALNHRDLWIIKGRYARIEFPAVLGSDGMGWYEGKRVVLNPGMHWGHNLSYQSSAFQVLGMPSQGTFAESIAIAVEQIYDVPEHLSDEEAAALPLAGLTAFRALFSKGHCTTEDTVLITGIGGGVATTTLVFALAAGAKVYVTSGSGSKIEKAVNLGAAGGFLYSNDQWMEEAIEQTGGVDLIIDGAAGDDFSSYPELCNYGGRIVNYGGTAGKIPELKPQVIFWKQLQILGTTMGSPVEFGEMLQFVKEKQIHPVIDRVFAMADVSDAFERMDQTDQFGKIILRNR